ncbi:kinase-like protein [Aspergillus cavernicola]|uniref:Kinase-like protein n=1 Tax=Aspergillus cavernicola TaxID=176166 RepID=A0ABR4I4T3_9EURO
MVPGYLSIFNCRLTSYNLLILLHIRGKKRYIVLGSAGAIFEDNNRQIIKTPIKHDLRECSEEVVEVFKQIEYISEQCMSREKLIYRTLPKNANILDCLAITERGLHFPHHRLGNPIHIRDRWIKNAIDAIILVHDHGVIYAGIGTRNFLVAEDLSIKLCDFAGSVIGDQATLVEEKDRYRIAPRSPRTVKTDLFALGCLIYEISSGAHPYSEIEDLDEVARLYAAQVFPPLDGFR